MAEPENLPITIHQAIIHKVDHRNYDAPQLSDLPSPLSDEAASFLRRQIATNREHKNARTAAFLPEAGGQYSRRPVEDSREETAGSGGPPPATCLPCLADDLLAHPDNFIADSQEIPRRLFGCLDRRTSPGDLVACTFSDGEPGEEGPSWLALLKMDPEDGFVGERHEQDGHVFFVLQRVPNVLPRGNLQKCAFILPLDLRAGRDYDLLVLDQQATRYGTDRAVASFFSRSFLQCHVGLNAADRTAKFVIQSHEWLTGKKGQWPEEDVQRFQEQVSQAVQAEMVDVPAFAEAQIADPAQRDEYVAYLRRKGLEELTFATDPEERRRLTRYVVFQGDNDLTMRVLADATGPGKMVSWVASPNTNIVTVTIRTTRWDKVVK